MAQQPVSAPAPAAATARAPAPAPAQAPAPPPEISLAAALFGFPAAAGFYVPSKEGIPEPWRRDFIARYADAAVLLGLFQSCRTGRDWILQAARTARLTLHMTAQQVQSCGWFRQLTAAQAALATRGGDATALTVRSNLGPKPLPQHMVQAAVWCLVMFLVESGMRISELTLRHVWDYSGSECLSKLLSQAATGFAGTLTSLQLRTLDTLVPPPEQLPQLRQIEFTCSGDNEMYDAIEAHIPTLTHLTCTNDGDTEYSTGVIKDMLRPPHSISQTLTHLAGDLTLDTELLGLILDRLPTLRRLGVYDIAVGNEHVGRQWGVEHLSVQYPVTAEEWEEHIDLTFLNTLTLLPQSTVERVCIEVPNCMYLDFTDTQGFAPHVYTHLKKWTFKLGDSRVVVRPDDDMPQTQRHTALVKVLQQIGEVHAPGASVEIEGWAWKVANV